MPLAALAIASALSVGIPPGLSLDPPICAGGAPVWPRQAAPRSGSGPPVVAGGPAPDRCASGRGRAGRALGPPGPSPARPGGPADRPAVTQLGGSRLRGRELDRLPTKRREVALTIDAGDTASGGWRMVSTLLRRRVPATFFLTGRWARRNPRLARAIGSHFPLGNHTWSHPPLTRLASPAVATEIRRGAQAIRRSTRRDPRPLFRFPYGDSDARTLRIANDLGYVSIRWTVDTLAWTGSQTVAGAVRRVVSRLRPGAIVLMHVGPSVDARALPRIIDAITKRGYRLTTLERVGR